MKAKHLFFAMALPGLFAACTQEEWTSNEANNSLELAKRHNAGVVEFTIDGDEAETRFNHELGRFDNGEEIDLYLMDELTGNCDNGDANHMHGYNTSVQCWKYFNVWDELYTLKDYAQTRYPFAYDETSQTWKTVLLFSKVTTLQCIRVMKRLLIEKMYGITSIRYKDFLKMVSSINWQWITNSGWATRLFIAMRTEQVK